MASTLVALPVLGLVIGLAIQLALLFEVKTTLNHAALQGARAGMVARANREAIRTGVVRGMLPLYIDNASRNDLLTTLTKRAFPDILINSCIRILNPTHEAVTDFQTFGGPLSQGLEIPNDQLAFRDPTPGSRSGISLQDANLLKVYMVYGAPLRVPIVGRLMTESMLLTGDFGGFERELLEKGRMPIVATATVRMQSPARFNNYMVTRDELENGPLCTQNLVPSFLDFDSLDPNTKACLVKEGATLLTGIPECISCRTPTSRTCIDCLQNVGSVLGCFFGNDAN